MNPSLLTVGNVGAVLTMMLQQTSLGVAISLDEGANTMMDHEAHKVLMEKSIGNRLKAARIAILQRRSASASTNDELSGLVCPILLFSCSAQSKSNTST